MRIKKNLDIILCEKIKEGFIRGEYLLGQKIDIDKLAEKYEVSRTPVIQAIKLLENEGILETGRGGKIMIPLYTPEKIRETYEVRILLEKYAVKCAIRNDNHKDINFEKLQYYADECQRGYEIKDIVMASKADLKFHSTLVKTAENNCLNDIFDKVQGQCMVVNYLWSNSSPRNQENSCKEHSEIIAALKKSDLKKCGEMIELHLNNNIERLLSRFPMEFTAY